MLITHEELKKKFSGSNFIVGTDSNGIWHVCDSDYTMLVYYENNNTYVISNTSYLEVGKRIDISFLMHFKHTKLMSWYEPETKDYGRTFRMYELQGWRC